jgi:hypothetical protein
VDAAVDQAMEEARKAGRGGGIDFDTFMTMMRASSTDSLDMYDDRSGSSRYSPGSSTSNGAYFGRGGFPRMEKSLKGAEHYARSVSLAPVRESARESS